MSKTNKNHPPETYDLPAITAFADRELAHQTYGGEPYGVHNKEVRGVLTEFGYTAQTHPFLHAAADIHDFFEDTQHLFNREEALRRARAVPIGERAISIALFVTDPEGANRKERKTKTYMQLQNHQFGGILKLADRLANVRRGGKRDMYRAEYPEFKKQLQPVTPDATPMWHELDRLLA